MAFTGNLSFIQYISSHLNEERASQIQPTSDSYLSLFHLESR